MHLSFVEIHWSWQRIISELSHMASSFILWIGSTVAESCSKCYIKEATKNMSYFYCTTCLSKSLGDHITTEVHMPMNYETQPISSKHVWQ